MYKMCIFVIILYVIQEIGSSVLSVLWQEEKRNKNGITMNKSIQRFPLLRGTVESASKESIKS